MSKPLGSESFAMQYVVPASVFLLMVSVGMSSACWCAPTISPCAPLSICNANRHIGLALLLSGQYLHMKDALPGVAAWRSLSWELSERSFTSVKRKC